MSHRIDILEGKLFEKEQENHKLKKEINDLNNNLEDQRAENEKLVKQIHKVNKTNYKKINDLEQYGRINNLRITGVPEDKDIEETAEMTSRIVMDKLNSCIENLHLQRHETDISHRLGPTRAPPSGALYARGK